MATGGETPILSVLYSHKESILRAWWFHIIHDNSPSPTFNPLDPYVIIWVCSYLSDREQFVVINGAQSPVLPVVSGITQGSVLGPLLFLIFIDDVTCGKKWKNGYICWRHSPIKDYSVPVWLSPCPVRYKYKCHFWVGLWQLPVFELPEMLPPTFF